MNLTSQEGPWWCRQLLIGAGGTVYSYSSLYLRGQIWETRFPKQGYARGVSRSHTSHCEAGTGGAPSQEPAGALRRGTEVCRTMRQVMEGSGEHVLSMGVNT